MRCRHFPNSKSECLANPCGPCILVKPEADRYRCTTCNDTGRIEMPRTSDAKRYEPCPMGCP